MPKTAEVLRLLQLELIVLPNVKLFLLVYACVECTSETSRVEITWLFNDYTINLSQSYGIVYLSVTCFLKCTIAPHCSVYHEYAMSMVHTLQPAN